MEENIREIKSILNDIFRLINLLRGHIISKFNLLIFKDNILIAINDKDKIIRISE